MLYRAVIQTLFLQILDARLRSVGGHVEHRGIAEHIVIAVSVTLGRDDGPDTYILNHEIGQGRRLRGQDRVGQEKCLDTKEELN